MSLTVKKTAKLIRAGKAGRHLDGAGGGGVRGLYLSVVNRKAAAWVLRYQLAGRERFMGLGSARDFTLAEARERATQARKALADRIDPLAARQLERAKAAAAVAKIMTFDAATKAFFADRRSSWTNPKHAAQFASSMQAYVSPIIGTLPVGEIDVTLVLKVLEQPVPAAKGKAAGSFWRTRTETANRVRGRIEAVIHWCAARGLRSGDNPAAWEVIGKVLPAPRHGAHHAAMPYAELPRFMAALRRQEGVAARALEFCITSCARSGEVLGAEWSEIDFANKTWIVPAARMKANREHRVALSDAAINLLEALPREAGNDRIFIGAAAGRGLSPLVMPRLLQRMGHDVTVHGFRSTFRDWAAETTNFPSECCELALAHRVGSKTELAYRRGDFLARRHALAADWAAFCSAPAPSNVVSIVDART